MQVQNVWWRYPTFSEKPNAWTLRDLSFQVKPGECFGITGPSGAGKTTLCRALLGIIPNNSRLTKEQLLHHYRGTINVLGEPVTEQTAASQKIGMVFQDPKSISAYEFAPRTWSGSAIAGVIQRRDSAAST